METYHTDTHSFVTLNPEEIREQEKNGKLPRRRDFAGGGD